MIGREGWSCIRGQKGWRCRLRMWFWVLVISVQEVFLGKIERFHTRVKGY